MKTAIKLAIIAIILFILIFLIVDYFNRYGINRIISFSEVEKLRGITSFEWDMTSSSDCEGLSTGILDHFYRKGKAFFIYRNLAHFAVSLGGRKIDIENYPLLKLDLFSDKPVMMQVVLQNGNDGAGPAEIGSIFSHVREGWSQIEIDLTAVRFFRTDTGGKKEYDLYRNNYVAGRVIFRFMSEFGTANYLIVDSISFHMMNKFVLEITDLPIWGKKEETEKWSEYVTVPLGIGEDARDLSLSIEPFKARPGMQLYYKRYGKVESGYNYSWQPFICGERGCRIPPERGGFIQIRIVIPVSTENRENGIERVILNYRGINPAGQYPPAGFYNAELLSNDERAAGLIQAPARNYRIIRLFADPVAFGEVQKAVAAGDLIIGIIEPGWDDVYLQRVVGLYGNSVSLWKIDARNSAFNIVAYRLSSLLPTATILPADNSGKFLYDSNRLEVGRRIESITPDYINLDRGPVFLSSLVLTIFIVCIGLQQKMNLRFDIRSSDLKSLGLSLVVAAAILIPLVFLLRLGSYKFITLEILLPALYRYGISAFIQELLRAIGIEYLVRIMKKKKPDPLSAYIKALFLTSIFFALVHFGYPGLESPRLFAFILITFIAGLIFGALYIRTKSVIPPFILHLVANLFLFTFTTI